LKVNCLDLNSIHPIIDLIAIDIYITAKLTYRFFLIYRPPNSSPIYSIISGEHYLKCITDFVNGHICLKGPTIITGDLNCPNIDWKLNKPLDSGREASLLVDFVNANGLSQYVDEPTHNAHILDIVLVNDALLLSSLSVREPFSISDHCSVVFSLSFETKQTASRQWKQYNWQQADWCGFNNFLNSVDWIYVLSVNLTVDLLWAAFCDILNLGISLFVPFRMNKTHNGINYPKHIRQLKSSRSRAWRVQKNNSDNSNLVENYKRLSNKYRDALCAHELDCERKVTEAGNLGTFYKFVNKKLTHPSGIGVLYDTNNKPIINDQHKAELLNSYFESVYVDDDGITPRCERKVSMDTKIVTVKFEPDIIYNIIRQLKPKTTCDPEGFSPLLIKRLISSITYPLSLIFDSFMSVS
jgi:hypothetical protein